MSVVGDVKEGALDIPRTIKNKPVVALAVGFFTLLLVLFIEAYRPGLITGPIKKLLTAVGVKSA
jgi:hypothetical protein